MSLNYYKLYVNQVMDLSKTMVIKVEAVADSINERLKATYGNVFDLSLNTSPSPRDGLLSRMPSSA